MDFFSKYLNGSITDKEKKELIQELRDIKNFLDESKLFNEIIDYNSTLYNSIPDDTVQSILKKILYRFENIIPISCKSNEPIVFISYAREDIEIAKILYNDLIKERITPWIDTENIIPGQNWKKTISSAIKKSTHILLLLSFKSISKKGFIQKEVKIALDLLEEMPPSEIFIIPVRLEPCIPLHERLKELHWIDLFSSYEAGLTKIINAIKMQNTGNRLFLNN